MPAVIDTHEAIDIEDIDTSALAGKVCQVPAARAGLWHRLTHRMSAYLSPLPHVPGAAAYTSDLRRFETPMDRCIREHPAVASYALAIV